MVKGLGFGVQARLNVAQTLSLSELGEGHADELLAAAEVPDRVFAVIALDGSLEGLAMNEISDLRKNITAMIHLGTLAKKSKVLMRHNNYETQNHEDKWVAISA